MIQSIAFCSQTKMKMFYNNDGKIEKRKKNGGKTKINPNEKKIRTDKRQTEPTKRDIAYT